MSMDIDVLEFGHQFWGTFRQEVDCLGVVALDGDFLL
jgi:hypothetical protein